MSTKEPLSLDVEHRGDCRRTDTRYVSRWHRLKPRPRLRPAGQEEQKTRVRHNLFVDLLTVLFGMGSWIAINGLFVQLPLLVQTQPEGWDLPSYISLVIQAANIGPVLYTVVHRLWPGRIHDSTIISCLLIMGSVTLFMLATFYKETTNVFGVERSVPLLTLVFFLALVGCTSSVLFMPYMANFHEIYLISYFVGEGLSGFVPSVIALVQGAGGNPTCSNKTQADGTVLVVPHVTRLPNFSTQVFFFLLFATMICSTVAFLLLNYFRLFKSSSVIHQTICPPTDKTSGIDSCKDEDCSIKLTEYSKETNQHIGTDGDSTNDCVATLDNNAESLSQIKSASLMFVVAWVCLLGNGIFPSIQSYSCLPYGNTVYHLSATLASMANPAACFLAFFLPIASIYSIFNLTLLSALVSCYIAMTAFTSPTPPLLNLLSGETLIVACWVVNTGLISYVKMSGASLYRRQGGRALFWCGAIQQLGSCLGALTAFLLINYTHTFTSYQPC